MLKKMSCFIRNNKGVTLVETLTAMAILSLIIFCFAPLFLSYFQSIDIAGDRLYEVYRESGVLQGAIGSKGTAENKNGYEAPVTDIPLAMSSQADTALQKTVETYENGKKVFKSESLNVTVNATGKAVTEAYDVNGKLGNIDASFIVSNPTNIKKGFETIYTREIDSNFQCFPTSITDDFVRKQIYIVAEGMGAASQLDSFHVYINNNPDNGKEQMDTKLTRGKDYDLDVCKDNKEIIILTVYGGKDINFENSPLTIQFGAHKKAIEVDAPTMIMVGEKDATGNDYHYYVSRGELDENGNLIVLQRTMNSNDPELGTVKLTSAMNDVEWVPAESSDGEGLEEGEEKYGYYVMCGDNGQIRRFWRHDNGNYYWGGDHTYYTDYNLNRFGSGTYIYTTDENGTPSKEKVYGLDTSFKFIAMRPMYWDNEGDVPNSDNAANHNDNKFRTGFNMGSKRYKILGATSSIAHLRNLCTVSVTYSDQVQFYASDGELYPYIPKSKDDTGNLPTVGTTKSFLNDSGKYNGHNVENVSKEGLAIYSYEAWGWMDPGDGTSSYYKINGLVDGDNKPTVDTKSYPITLTSVDAIRLSGSGAYEDTVKDPDKSHYFKTGIVDGTDTSGDATKGTSSTETFGTTETNLEYPTSSYTLYCGYIPAYMDAWGGVTGGSKYPYSIKFAGSGSAEKDKGQYALEWSSSDSANPNITNSRIGRASNRLKMSDNAEYNTIWRMTMGITPLVKGDNTAVDETAKGTRAYIYEKKGFLGIEKWYLQALYYPYTNIEYAITGKYYDANTYATNRTMINDLFPNRVDGYSVGRPTLLTSPANDRLNHTTSGKVVDITVSYLSHPLAISIAANPTDHVVYDMSNNRNGGQVFYWHNRRESITFLDSASTVIPSIDPTTKEPIDVPVSLMVGYVLGGLAMYGKEEGAASVDPSAVMNNGMVFLRAGNSEIDMQGTEKGDWSWLEEFVSDDAANSKTSEYMAVDKDGYKLAQESNVFHQFYYLNSIHTDTKKPEKYTHIGDIYGAKYWQNNRHIIQRSITGPAPSQGNDGSFEYLRAHPMSDTKVTCVAWGTTWHNNPEAMWGTENGTVLSWWVDLNAASGKQSIWSILDSSKSNWDDCSVTAEFQSYKWIDTVDNKDYAYVSTDYYNTIGSADGSGDNYTTKADFLLNQKLGQDRFRYFYDKTSQQFWNVDDIGKKIAFVSVLENINDIAYANDTWVAVGDQSGKAPADYCAQDVYKGNNTDDSVHAFAYTDNGRGGSWVNVRYWVNLGDNDKTSIAPHASGNDYYHWRAVKISNEENYNIVQINYVNGMWFATGYVDGDNDDEYDNGEKTVVCWTYNPLKSCNEGGWSDNTVFLANDGNGGFKDVTSTVGGINSVATRD